VNIVAGVDGCRAGWACVSYSDGPSLARLGIFPDFTALVDALPRTTIVAVDMPIGLPDRISRGGRGPEKLIRPLLGERQSSVFSIPSRRAVYSPGYVQACSFALATSSPRRKVSRQAFALFSKIREIDGFPRNHPEDCGRIIEVHPELAFWRLNRKEPMSKPKKVRGRVYPPGIGERSDLLSRHGYLADFLSAPVPRGVGADDVADACAVALIAARYARGGATPWPNPPLADRYGIPIAVWS
jgi:predicted RNase H-like nuclease